MKHTLPRPHRAAFTPTDPNPHIRVTLYDQAMERVDGITARFTVDADDVAVIDADVAVTS